MTDKRNFPKNNSVGREIFDRPDCWIGIRTRKLLFCRAGAFPIKLPRTNILSEIPESRVATAYNSVVKGLIAAEENAMHFHVSFSVSVGPKRVATLDL